MILGMSVATFTTFHVILSLIAIASGLAVLLSMLGGSRPEGLTGTFLATTVATSVTGFFFHSAFGPPQAIGLISLVVLAIALVALYPQRLTGAWRSVYVVTAAIALYLNCFVGVVQAFQKIPFLHQFAPTQTKEPAFVIAQLLLLGLFVFLTARALKRFPGRSRFSVV